MTIRLTCIIATDSELHCHLSCFCSRHQWCSALSGSCSGNSSGDLCTTLTPLPAGAGKVAKQVKALRQWRRWRWSSCASPWPSAIRAACTWCWRVSPPGPLPPGEPHHPSPPIQTSWPWWHSVSSHLPCKGCTAWLYAFSLAMKQALLLLVTVRQHQLEYASLTKSHMYKLLLNGCSEEIQRIHCCFCNFPGELPFQPLSAYSAAGFAWLVTKKSFPKEVRQRCPCSISNGTLPRLTASVSNSNAAYMHDCLEPLALDHGFWT